MKASMSMSLDLWRPDIVKTVCVKQGDTGRCLEIHISEGHRPYELDPRSFVILAAEKPDGTILYDTCDIRENAVYYSFTPQTASCPGRFPGEIRIHDGKGKLLTTARFLFEVSPQTVPENAVVSEDEKTGINEMMNQCVTLRNALEDKLQKGEFQGESAYETAKRLGYPGTEEQWIQSLQYDHSQEFTALADQVRQGARESQDAAARAESAVEDLQVSTQIFSGAVVNSVMDRIPAVKDRSSLNHEIICRAFRENFLNAPRETGTSFSFPVADSSLCFFDSYAFSLESDSPLSEAEACLILSGKTVLREKLQALGKGRYGAVFSGVLATGQTPEAVTVSLGQTATVCCVQLEIGKKPGPYVPFVEDLRQVDGRVFESNILNVEKCSFAQCDLLNGTIRSNKNGNAYCTVSANYLVPVFRKLMGRQIWLTVPERYPGKTVGITIYGERMDGKSYQAETGVFGENFCSIWISEQFTSIRAIELRINVSREKETDNQTVFKGLQLSLLGPDYFPFVDGITLKQPDSQGNFGLLRSDKNHMTVVSEYPGVILLYQYNQDLGSILEEMKKRLLALENQKNPVI